MSDRPCDFKRDRDAQRVGLCVRCKVHFRWRGYPLIRDARCPDCGMDLVRQLKGVPELGAIDRKPLNASRYLQ